MVLLDGASHTPAEAKAAEPAEIEGSGEELGVAPPGAAGRRAPSGIGLVRILPDPDFTTVLGEGEKALPGRERTQARAGCPR